MSDIRDPERDQVAPTPNDEPSCHDLVIQDMLERKQHGLRKYDSLLQPFNGRSFTQDAYEEVLDLAAYLRGRLEEERKAPEGRIGVIRKRNAEGRPLVIDWISPEDVVRVSSVTDFQPDDVQKAATFDVETVDGKPVAVAFEPSVFPNDDLTTLLVKKYEEKFGDKPTVIYVSNITNYNGTQE